MIVKHEFSFALLFAITVGRTGPFPSDDINTTALHSCRLITNILC